MNVLLTSIGRRVSLARAFREEIAAYAPGGRLLGADVSRLSAGFHDADAGFLVPRCTEADYIPQLLDIVLREIGDGKLIAEIDFGSAAGTGPQQT